MKKLLIFGVIVFIFSSCSNKNKSRENINDWARYDLLGNVKCVHEISYETVVGTGGNKKILYDVQIIFNAIGFVTTYGHYTFTYRHNSSGLIIEKLKRIKSEIVLKETFKYDDKNRIIEWRCYTPKGFLYSLQTYSYYENGKMFEEIRFIINVSFEKFIYYYDLNGNISYYFKIRTGNSPILKYICKYDYKDNLYKKECYEINGKPLNRMFYKYNEKGYEAGVRCYSGDESIRYTWTYAYRYDEKGNWINKIWYQDAKEKGSCIRVIDYY